jgi:NhaP-type Na+/H+ or K+/H+ antiporter
VLFVGWFGPRGIASLIYGLLLFEDHFANGGRLFHIIVITVLLSTFLHGLSAVPLARRYGDRAEAMKDEVGMPELEPVSEMPLRF